MPDAPSDLDVPQSGGERTESAAWTTTLFSRHTLLVFCLGAVAVSAVSAWMMGGVSEGQGLLATLLVLVVGLGVGGFARWRFRIGLRSFLVLVTILAIVLAFVAQIALRVRRIDSAVRQVESEGAQVMYDTARAGGDWFRASSGVLLPGWMRTTLGDSAFGDVISVDFYNVEASEKQLKLLAENCPTVTRFSFYQAKIEPGVFTHFGYFPELEFLDFHQSSLTDEGLASMPPVAALEYLNLSFTEVTPEGLKQLYKHRRLKTIWLNGPCVSDQGVDALATMPQTEHLVMLSGKMTDASAESLVAKFPNLRFLQLNGNPSLTSKSAQAFAKIPRLAHLSLYGTQVDDKGLAALEACPGLKHVDVQLTDVTEEGVQRFREARPNVTLKHSFSDIP